MATSTILGNERNDMPGQRLVLRVADPEFSILKGIVFCRYPDYEWATFVRFGWRDTPDALVVTLAGIDTPIAGDLNEQVGHVAIDEQYTLRIALNAERHRLAVGIIHSHPEGGAPFPSRIDDDMDSYYARYFSDFAPGRPYVSLILSVVDGKLVISGRAFWRDRWLVLERTAAERIAIETWPGGHRPVARGFEHDRVARFANAFGEEALQRLRDSTVAIIGAGGTGSGQLKCSHELASVVLSLLILTKSIDQILNGFMAVIPRTPRRALQKCWWHLYTWEPSVRPSL